MKKDARVTLRIPTTLKDRLDGIDRIYRFGVPKIGSEFFTTFRDTQSKPNSNSFQFSLVRASTAEQQPEVFAQKRLLFLNLN
jgi:hypothetical protein